MSTIAKDDDRAWEKELAPRVTRGKIIFIAAIFALWIAFLTFVAANRWFGSLQ